MERSLVLVFTDNGELVLPLMTGSASEIDEFTSRYNDSNELRGAFIDKIKSYMVNNYRVSYLKQRSSGQIALFNGNCEDYKKSNNKYNFDFSREKRVRVLYKKDIEVIDEVIQYEFMRVYWKEQKAKHYNPYEIIRATISHYINSRKTNHTLPTIDRLWKESLKKKDQMAFVTNKDNELCYEETPKHIIVNGSRYLLDDRDMEQIDGDMFIKGNDIELNYDFELVKRKK